MISDNTINIILLCVMLVSAIWSVLSIRLLRAAIGLAVTSAVLSIIMYRLGSPLAAVFELSVCAGLISVIFISAISLTQLLTEERLITREREMLKVLWILPILIIIAGVFFSQIHAPADINLMTAEKAIKENARDILWNIRNLDIIGQIVIILAGALGVRLLFKEKKND